MASLKPSKNPVDNLQTRRSKLQASRSKRLIDVYERGPYDGWFVTIAQRRFEDSSWTLMHCH